MAEPNITVADVPVIQVLGENILTAIIILLLGLVAGKLIGIALNKLFIEIQIDKSLGKFKKSNISIGKTISSFVSLAIYIGAIVMALIRVDIFNLMLIIIAYVVAIILIVALLLSFTDFFPNLIAGIKIKNKKIAEMGKKVKIKNAEGVVKTIGLLHTKLEGKNGEIFSVPNSLFVDKKYKN